ncbi:MAG: RagB/SusD family nutrient uptake outer membrane protein [Chryseobacterium sp.]|nr:MAG: RagB/SusD family nutrient uptake outer membrane protein [Chryseobacterium sp.]
MKISNIYITLLFLLVTTSCRKDFLNEIPDKSLLIPKKIIDFQSLLDNASVMNQAPYLPAIACDDIFTTTAGYNSASSIIRNTYVWKKEDMFDGAVTVHDWNIPFQAVYYANTVLDGLSDGTFNANETSDVNRLKGQALFYRAFAYYLLAQEFCRPYTQATAGNLPGIPIRLVSDVKLASNRGTLKQTYEQIESDLLNAIPLLPTNVEFKTQPKLQAGLALLSNVYLTMQNYNKALEYAEKCLAINSQLIDYNTLSITAARPFPASFKNLHEEVLFYHTVLSVAFLNSSATTLISPDLYSSYDSNDLRKSIFFTSNVHGIVFKGNYTGTTAVFSGLSLDEVYLIKAECHARLDNKEIALNTLNDLMRKRWNNKVAYPVIGASDAKEALRKVLIERRKELVYRNNRWFDLKRLNIESALSINLARTVNNINYTLPANDFRYTFPIPDIEITTSGIEQNER